MCDDYDILKITQISNASQKSKLLAALLHINYGKFRYIIILRLSYIQFY